MNRLAVILLLCTALLPAAGVDVQLTVSLINPQPPVVTVPTTVVAGLGIPFSMTIVVANGPATFSASGLPSGLSIDPITGVIRGTPTQAGVSQATITVVNANGTTVVTLTFEVRSVIGGVTPDSQLVGGGASFGCGAGRGLAALLILLATAGRFRRRPA